MRMKKIQAETMQEAMLLARKEMGDEAIMLQSHKAPDGQGIVVTFALDADDLPSHETFADVPSEPKRQTAAATAPKKSYSSNAILQLIDDILRWHGTPRNLHASLLEKARDIEVPSGDINAASHAVLRDMLANTFKFAPLTGERTPRAVMCVGAPGVGKSFTIAKLATDAVKRGTKVCVVTTDTSRAAAYDQLAAFTDILQVKLDIAESRTQLRTILQERTPDTHLLIDSAGCNPYDFQELKQLGELAKLQGIEPLLVLPLGIDGSEAMEIAGVFSFLDIERLIITRVDCARRFGGVLAAMEAGQYALSNVGASLRVSDGCPALDAATLAEFLLRPARERLS